MAPIRESMLDISTWSIAVMISSSIAVIFLVLILIMCGCCDQEKKKVDDTRMGETREKKDGNEQRAAETMGDSQMSGLVSSKNDSGKKAKSSEDGSRREDSKRIERAALGEDDDCDGLPPPPYLLFEATSLSMRSSIGESKVPGNTTSSKPKPDVRSTAKEDTQKQFDRKTLSEERHKSGMISSSSVSPTPSKPPTSISQNSPSRGTLTDNSKSQHSRGRNSDDPVSLVDKSKSR